MRCALREGAMGILRFRRRLQSAARGRVQRALPKDGRPKTETYTTYILRRWRLAHYSFEGFVFIFLTVS